jgi:hypothetical protein
MYQRFEEAGTDLAQVRVVVICVCVCGFVVVDTLQPGRVGAQNQHAILA